MIAIVTRYMSPTDTKGPRFRATWDGPKGLQSIDVAFSHSMNIGDQHVRAARMAVEGMGLRLVGSAPVPGGKGWAHIAQEAEQ